jgi:hypothetical protein
MLSAIMLNVGMLSAIMVNVVMLSVIMLNVVMLSVAAPILNGLAEFEDARNIIFCFLI